jgi:hypothetical protein
MYFSAATPIPAKRRRERIDMAIIPARIMSLLEAEMSEHVHYSAGDQKCTKKIFCGK